MKYLDKLTNSIGPPWFKPYDEPGWSDRTRQTGMVIPMADANDPVAETYAEFAAARDRRLGKTDKDAAAPAAPNLTPEELEVQERVIRCRQQEYRQRRLPVPEYWLTPEELLEERAAAERLEQQKRQQELQREREEERQRHEETRMLVDRFCSWVRRHRPSAPSTGKRIIDIFNPLPPRAWALRFDRYELTVRNGTYSYCAHEFDNYETTYSYAGLLVCEQSNRFMPAERSKTGDGATYREWHVFNAHHLRWTKTAGVGGCASSDYGPYALARRMAEIAIACELPPP